MSGMLYHQADGPFVVVTTSGTSTAAERKALVDAIRSDPNVLDGAYLIVDFRKYTARLEQSELQDRVRTFLENLKGKISTVCAVVVRDTTLRIGINFQVVATNMNFRVGVFNDTDSARKWIIPYAAALHKE